VRARSLLPLAVAVITVPAGMVAGPLSGCSSSNTPSGINPVTEIVIRSESLVAGYGCGTAPGEVYKYAAIVSNVQSPTTQYANVFDCFADGVFASLPASPTGNLDFTVQILAYSFADYNPGIEAAADDPAALASSPATWTTSCTATQQPNVAVLAVCGPLTSAGPPAPDAGSPDGASLDAGSADAADSSDSE
jgi:hypothetical protein